MTRPNGWLRRMAAASVGVGHWLAWWPKETTASKVVAHDGAGAVLATLDAATLGQPR